MSYVLYDNWIENILLCVGYIDYKYVEIEDGVVGIVFFNKIIEVCVIVEYKLGFWYGMVGYYYIELDYDVDGEEVFILVSVIKINVLFMFEEC